MISKYYDDKASQLIESNPEIKTAFDKVSEENRLILSRLTHELRNPLTLVRSTIQLIESQHPEVVEFKYWKQILSDLDDTVEILNEFSIYNHCDELHKKDTNLYELVSQSIDSSRPLALAKEIDIELTQDEHTPIYIPCCCDPVKIREVVTNLLKNAVEAALESTTIQVGFSLSSGSKTNGHYIDISITDTGTPINPDLLDQIFLPFVTTKPNGTGLGLTISQKIAQLHQGSLSISQTDSTVTFTLQLPVM